VRPSCVSNDMLLFWSDIQFFRIAQDNEKLRFPYSQNGLAKEIFSSYMHPKNVLGLSQEIIEDISQKIQQNFVTNLYDSISELIFMKIMELPIGETVSKVLTSFIDCKRTRGYYPQIPQALLQRVMDELGDNRSWKCFHNEDGVQKFKKKSNNHNYIVLKEQTLINTPPHVLTKFLAEPDEFQWKEMDPSIDEVKIIEHLSNGSAIVHHKMSVLQKKLDSCVVKSTGIMKDGTAVVLGCSVEHKVAPIREKYKRQNLMLFICVAKPIGDHQCEAQHILMFSLVGQPMFKLVSKSEWLLGKFGNRILKWKQSVEKYSTFR